MAGPDDFDLVAMCARGIPPFEVGIDGPVFCRYRHPARFAFPGGYRDECFEIVNLSLSFAIGLLRFRE